MHACGDIGLKKKQNKFVKKNNAFWTKDRKNKELPTNKPKRHEFAYVYRTEQSPKLGAFLSKKMKRKEKKKKEKKLERVPIGRKER
jgi:hypothetical protein